MAETTVSVEGFGTATGATAEPGLRLMALEDRFSRRVLAQAFLEFFRRTREGHYDRYARVVIALKNNFTGIHLIYVFMSLKYLKDLVPEGGYEQYRQARMSMLEIYCLAALHENRNLHYAVGIAMDVPSVDNSSVGGSEDFIALSVDEWTADLEAAVEHGKQIQEILQKDRIEVSRLHDEEYPASDGVYYPNRQQRRAAERKFRKTR